MSRHLAFACALLAVCGTASAQFVDEFVDRDLDGWTFATGDGEAEMDMRPEDGYASVVVDATRDRYNVWWALIKREVGQALDLRALGEPGRELRIEARIRVSHAPRRVNLHLNTQRTVDFHSHLMEFDIPDTSGWHTISMTTRGFDARPGDTVNAQLALIDWGRGRYKVDLDYLRVDVVDTARAGPDLGEPLPYQPRNPPVESFAHHLLAAEAATVDSQFPTTNLRRWRTGDGTPVLIVDGTRYVLLRWDFRAVAGRKAIGSGVLALPTHSVQRAELEMPELGQVRITEILGGDPDWSAQEVTFDRFTRGEPLDEVVNGQMIVDAEPAEGDTIFAAISRPVLQRLIDGETRGIILQPLGPISATFYAQDGPVLHFNLDE